MFKVDNRNSRATCEICSKLTKTPELRHWLCSGVFIFNFEHTSHLVLMFLLLTLRRQCWKLNANWKGSFVYVTKITRFEVIQQMWWCRNSKLYAKSIRAPELGPQENYHPEIKQRGKILAEKYLWRTKPTVQTLRINEIISWWKMKYKELYSFK